MEYGRKKIFLILVILKVYLILIKKDNTSTGDIPKDLEEDPGKIIRHPIVWLCNWSVRGDTMPESSYTPKKELSLSGIGPLAYNLLHTLYPILSDAKEDKKWLKPIKARNNWSSF